jgi:hypothetical protein
MLRGVVVDAAPAVHLRFLWGGRMSPADVYGFVCAGCSDAEILAWAAMTADGSPWRAIKQARGWLNVVRDDQIRRRL